MMLISVGAYLAAAVVTFAILFLAWRGVLAYFRFRGVRLVSCPETAESAAVEVNARHAALTRGLGHVELTPQKNPLPASESLPRPT